MERIKETLRHDKLRLLHVIGNHGKRVKFALVRRHSPSRDTEHPLLQTRKCILAKCLHTGKIHLVQAVKSLVNAVHRIRHGFRSVLDFVVKTF